jgi:tetratricopeptide (TPR) repeat protein
MGQEQLDPSAAASQPVRRPGRRRLVVAAVAFGGIALAAAVAVYWWQSPAAAPPQVDLTGLDRPVAAAIEEAHAAVSRSPRSAAAWGKLGQVLLANDFLPESVSCLSQAERLDPREPRWPYLQGTLLLFSDVDAALAKLRRAAELGGDRVPATRLKLAEVLLGQGRLDEAEDQLQRVLAREPGHPWAHLCRGRVALDRGDLMASRQHLGLAAANPLTAKTARQALAQVDQRQGDAAAAAGELRTAADLPEDPGWPDSFADEIKEAKAGKQALVGRAQRLTLQRRPGEALQVLEQLVHDYPDWDEGWLFLGRARLQQGDWSGAEASFRSAARVAPASVQARFYRGIALQQLGQPGAAVPCFREALRLKPEHALAHCQLGHCLKLTEDREGAIAAYWAALSYQPHLAEAHAGLGELLARAGRKEEALVHLRQALDLSPSDAATRALLKQLEGAAAGPRKP